MPLQNRPHRFGDLIEGPKAVGPQGSVDARHRPVGYAGTTLLKFFELSA
jgi:hypothetical protein